MMKRLFIAFIAFALISFPLVLHAIPAYPHPVRVLQPDGTTVTLRMYGDEFMNYTSTDDGYTVVLDKEGFYVYAGLEKGTLIPTNYRAKDVALRTKADQEYLAKVGKRLVADTTQTKQRRVAANVGYARKGLSTILKAPGTKGFRGLVILVNYKDASFRRDNANDVWSEMINKANYTGYMDGSRFVSCTGSVRDYYYDNSGGLFNPKFDVVGPVQIDYSKTYINQTDNADQVMQAACKAADDLVDFSDYDVDGDGEVDMVYFIFAGYGSNVPANNPKYLWPHASGFNNFSSDGVRLGRYACSTELGDSERAGTATMDGIGAICHEFCHVLGLKDMYDTDYEGSGGLGLHPNSWSVMASGNYLNMSRTPCGFSLYERYLLNWATPRLITEEGDYSLRSLSDTNEGYRINTLVEGEFFLLENRQRTGWDAYLAGHGMLVFRVDSTNQSVWSKNKVNVNPSHQYYELVRANGARSMNDLLYDSGTDPFPGTGNVTSLTNDTKANLLTWAGKRSPIIFTDIAEQNGIVTFKSTADMRAYVENFEAMPLTDTAANITNVKGLFSNWKLENAWVQAPGSEKANGEHSVGMVKGGKITLTDPVYIKVNTASFTVWNPTSVPVTMRLYYSTTNGVVWTKATTLSGKQEVTVSSGKSAQLEFKVNASLSTVYSVLISSGSTTERCYIDDFSLQYDSKIAGASSSSIASDGTQSWVAYREDDRVIVENRGETSSDVCLYSVAGLIIGRDRWQGEEKLSFPLSDRGVYFVYCGGKSVKVVY